MATKDYFEVGKYVTLPPGDYERIIYDEQASHSGEYYTLTKPTKGLVIAEVWVGSFPFDYNVVIYEDINGDSETGTILLANLAKLGKR